MKNNTVFYIDPQSYGNLARYDYNLLSNMTDNIVFVCSRLYDFRPLNNVTSLPVFSYSKYKNSILKTFSYLCSMLWLFFYICKYQPSCIHIQWFKIPAFDYHYYKFLKSLFHFRIIHTAHNLLPHNTGNKYLAVYNRLYRLSDGIIVHTNDTKEKMITTFGIESTKVHVVRHGLLHLDYDAEKYLEVKKRLNNVHNLDGKFVFVSLGEQSHYKGFDIITNAWLSTPELRDNERIALVLAGTVVNEDISEISKCHNVIVNNSFIEEEEFIFWLHRADTYLLAYREISQSGALLTALAEHVPVLVSDLGGLTEPFQVANVGWKIEELSVKCLAERMKYLIAHPEESLSIRTDDDAWDKIEEFYSWNSISKTTQDLYFVSAS